jgi:anti-anti-sigma factor
MEISDKVIESDILKIELSGRMDIIGVGEIETQFAGLTSSSYNAIIVDMTDVPYMSSIGIRALLMNGKAVSGRGGKFAIYNPQPNVLDVLKVSGIDQILTICTELDDAIAAVKA